MKYRKKKGRITYEKEANLSVKNFDKFVKYFTDLSQNSGFGLKSFGKFSNFAFSCQYVKNCQVPRGRMDLTQERSQANICFPGNDFVTATRLHKSASVCSCLKNEVRR